MPWLLLLQLLHLSPPAWAPHAPGDL